MKPVLLLFATREGHTHRIVEHILTRLNAQGLSGDIVDSAHLPEKMDLQHYCAAFICGSVHAGKHEREIVNFVKRRRPQLERMPAVFLSVSLSEAGVELPTASPAQRAQASADVEQMVNEFLKETGWRPARIKAIAGALLYTKYNFMLRFLMKRIAEQAGGDTDTSKDYEYTDWKALDLFIDQSVKSLQLTKAASAAESPKIA
jgi:menaquinone-dependent protoporphyrinogen oxidase